MAIFSPFDVPEPKNSEKSPKTTLGTYLEYCVFLDSERQYPKSFQVFQNQ